MTKKLEVYKCEICGNITMVMHKADGELVCCGQPMKLMKENTVDAANEKHVPIIEKKKDGYLVKVGSVAHPMEAKHYIEWIELIVDNKSYVEFLKPNDKPEAMFKVSGKKITAREYCNLHALWKSK